MNICLERYRHEEHQTIGKLFVYDVDGGLTYSCHTLELPWLENRVRISRIPEGTYMVHSHTSPKFGKCFWIKDVSGRSEILIHKGNYNKDTLGCILVGEGLHDINGDGKDDVTSSGSAMAKLLEILPTQFNLTIKNK